MERSAGILLPIFSLPSPYGAGTLGAAAYEFVDFLSAAGQRVWQILPLGPTLCGDSPYSPFSSFAGNPYFIDLEFLREQGLLAREEIEAVDWGGDAGYVNYDALHAHRLPLLRRAWERLREREGREMLSDFVEREPWAEDYALFMALKGRFGTADWRAWPEALRRREAAALEEARREVRQEADFHLWTQREFRRQWDDLHGYARERGVAILGDLPIYAAMESADVWAAQDVFQLREDGTPRAVAGAPPDYFNPDGQLWNNPLYDWERLASAGYEWWLRRAEETAALCDMLRLDHFRGLESYWSVPFGETTARNGRWEKGPGLPLVEALRRRLPDTPVIAEDLGYLTPEVHALREASGFPGMKILQFAFGAGELSDYLPHNYGPGCVCYTGTHDNETLVQWLAAMAPADRDFARRYLGLNDAEGYARGVIRGGMASAAALFIAPMADWLGLGAEGRINVPGVPKGNWRWRLRPGQAAPELAAEMRECARIYGR